MAKVFCMFVNGLLVALFFYPFLHELGHCTAAFFCGAKIYDFAIFPISYTICEMNSLQGFQYCLIGIAGMLFPFLVSLFIPVKYFWLWLISFYLKLISVFAFAISYVAIICLESGIVLEDEDIIKAIEFSDVKSSFLLLMMLLFFILAFMCLYNNKPLQKILKFFGVY